MVSFSRNRLHLLGACCALCVATAVQGQVVVDGTTSTVISLGADGSVTVGIAPAASNGVSLNRYSDFNVGPNGVILDNQTEAARTIVNEVTSTRQTKIAGTLSVAGQTAHVIVANPNGIVIDGGRFVNTGRVALITGAISSTSNQIAPGIFQDNVTATVTKGRISVEGGGLSGQMDAIDLIAHQIQIAGLVSNTNPDLNSGLRIAAGNSVTRFESSVVPGNTALSWGTITGAGETTNSVLVEILRPGVLRANRIGIEINANGAGARFAGEGYATARQFSLRSDGLIVLQDATISGVEGVSINAAAIDSANVKIDTQSGSMQLTAVENLDLTDTVAAAFGNITVVAGRANLKSLTKQTQLVAQNGSLVFTTTGSLTMGHLVNDGGLLQGAIKVDGLTNLAGTQSDGAVTLFLAGSFVNAKSMGFAGTVLGTAGDVTINAGRDVINTQSKVLANGDLRILAAGSVTNDVVLANGGLSPTVLRQTRQGARQWWTLWLKRRQETTLSYNYGTLADAAMLSAIGATGNVLLTADEITNRGGQIYATDGDVIAKADLVENASVGSGKIVVRKTCVVLCSYKAMGTIATFGGQITAGNSIDITATEQFSNLGGMVVAEKNLTVTADRAVLEAVAIPYLVNRPKGLYNFWQSSAAWIYLRDQFGAIVADTGKITVRSPHPLKIIGGEVIAPVAPDLQNGAEIVRTPEIRSDAFGFEIGLFRDLPLLWN